jgi:hypothetical protein
MRQSQNAFMAGEFKEAPSRARWRRLCDAILGARGLDRSRIAELWLAQAEKADPWQVSA